MSHSQKAGGRRAAATPADYRDPRAVDAWLDVLCGLDAEAWRTIGRLCLEERRATRMRDAQRELGGMLARDRADVDVWMLRDQVETICHVAEAACRDRSRAARRELLAGRDAAQWAILAVAFGDRISAADAALLCSPFTDALPRPPVRSA